MLQVLAGVGRVFDRWGAAVGMLPLLVAVAGIVGSLFFGAKVLFGGPSRLEVAEARRAATAETIALTERAGAAAVTMALERAARAEEMAGKARAEAAAAETAKRDAWEALRAAEVKSNTPPSKCLSDAAVRRINEIRKGAK